MVKHKYKSNVKYEFSSRKSVIFHQVRLRLHSIIFKEKYLIEIEIICNGTLTWLFPQLEFLIRKKIDKGNQKASELLGLL